MFKRLYLIIVSCFFLSAPLKAELDNQIEVHLTSKHIPSNYNFNELNLGLGLVHCKTKSSFCYTVGGYRNSKSDDTEFINKKISLYWGVKIPLLDQKEDANKTKKVPLFLEAGAVSGYKEVPVPVISLSTEIKPFKVSLLLSEIDEELASVIALSLVFKPP